MLYVTQWSLDVPGPWPGAVWWLWVACSTCGGPTVPLTWRSAACCSHGWRRASHARLGSDILLFVKLGASEGFV